MRRFDKDINMRQRNCLSLKLKLVYVLYKGVIVRTILLLMPISNIDLVGGRGVAGGFKLPTSRSFLAPIPFFLCFLPLALFWF